MCVRALREHPTHTSSEDGDQQNGVEVPYMSTTCLREESLLLQSFRVSIQWLPGSAHMTTEAKFVENLAGFAGVRCWKPISRVGGRGQRGLLDESTAAGAVVFRGGTE